MSAKSELLEFIENLTEEETEKIFSQLPKLSSLLEEATLSCRLEQI